MAHTIRPEAGGFFDDALTDRSLPRILAFACGEVELVAGAALQSEAAQQIADIQSAQLDALSESALLAPLPAKDSSVRLGYYSSAGGFHAL